MLEDLAFPIRQFPCRIRTAKTELSEKDATILESAVMNLEWPCGTLQNQLSTRGITVSEKSIKKHREKRCSCWKT
jgi:hypothetical protein